MPLVMIKSDARARQKPCLRCGYSLRNNIDARNCPECGLAVRISLNPDDSLDMSNPEWLTAMSRAVGLLVIAHVGFAAAVAWVQWGYFYRRGTRLLPLAVIRQVDIIVCSGLLVAAHAALVLATPERRYPDRLRPRRVLARFGAGLTFFAAGFELFLPPTAQRFQIPMFIKSCLVVFTALVVWSILHELARRIPSRRVMQATRVMGWSLGVGLILMVSFGPDAWVLYWVPWQPWSLLTWPWTLGTGLYVMATIPVLVACRRQLRVAARQARLNWVTDP